MLAYFNIEIFWNSRINGPRAVGQSISIALALPRSFRDQLH
jgi:hypothetical protein